MRLAADAFVSLIVITWFPLRSIPISTWVRFSFETSARRISGVDLSISFVIVIGLCCRLPVGRPLAASLGEMISCPIALIGMVGPFGPWNTPCFWPVIAMVPVNTGSPAGAPAGPWSPFWPCAPVVPRRGT